MSDEIEVDFFISRAGADAASAELIAGIVHEAGQTTFYQNEDFGHASFMRQIERGLNSLARVVVLLSQHYQESDFCIAEYNQVLSSDPNNLKQRLIVLRVEESQPTGNLAAIAYTDLVPYLTDSTGYRRLVRSALGIDVDRPAVDFLSAHRRQVKVLHNEVRPVRDFRGRKRVLDRLHSHFFGQEAELGSQDPVVALYGLSGVGKTVLAKHFANSHKEDYYGIWWIRGENRDSIIADLGALGRRVGVISDDLETAASQVLDWIRQTRTEIPWLIVYDNAEDQSLIRQFTPAENCHVLITTKVPDWQGEASEVNVANFDRETASNYLLDEAHLSSQGNTEDSAGRLADVLNCLPLALAHSRSYCRTRKCTFDQYIERLPELIRRAPRNGRYPRSVFATINLSLEEAIQESALAARIMAFTALLAADRIPIWLLIEPNRPELEIDDGLAALSRQSLIRREHSTTHLSVVFVHRLVQEVVRARLIEDDKYEETRDLVSNVLRQSFSEADPKDYADWIRQAQSFIQYSPKTGAGAIETIRFYLILGELYVDRGDSNAALENYEAARDLAAKPLEMVPGSTLFTLSSDKELVLAHAGIGDVNRIRGNLNAALESYKAMADIAEDTALIKLVTSPEGSDSRFPQLLEAYKHIGDIQVLQGDSLAAVKSYQLGLKLAEAVSKSVLASGDIGAVYTREYVEDARQGAADSSTAQTVSEALAAMRDELALGGKRGKLLHLLSRAESHLENSSPNSALRKFRSCISLADEIGKTDPSDFEVRDMQAAIHSRIGTTLGLQGEFTQAIDSFHESINALKESHSLDPALVSPQILLAAAWDGLGDLFFRRENPEKALDSYRASIKIRERLMALDSSNADFCRALSLSYDKNGKAHGAAGNRRVALQNYEKSLTIVESLLKRDLRNVDSQNDLSVGLDQVGSWWIEDGDLDQALAIYERKLKIDTGLEKLDASNSRWQSNLIISHGKIGEIRRGLGDLSAAVTSFKRRLAIERKFALSFPNSGEYLVDVVRTLITIGDLEKEIGHYDEALAAYGTARELSEPMVVNTSNEETKRSLFTLLHRIANVHLAKGELDKAREYFTHCKEISEQVLASNLGNIDWQFSMCQLLLKIGEIYLRQDDIQAALENLHASVGISEAASVPSQDVERWGRTSAAALLNAGNAHVMQGQQDLAQECFEARLVTLKGMVNLDGNSSEWQRELLITHSMLGVALRNQGQDERARRSLLSALDICERRLSLDRDDFEMRLASVFPLMQLGRLDGPDGRTRFEEALRILRDGKKRNRLGATERAWMQSIKIDIGRLSTDTSRSWVRSIVKRLSGR